MQEEATKEEGPEVIIIDGKELSLDEDDVKEAEP